MSHSHPPRPRQFAQQIANLPTKEERRRALEEVPEHLRDIVRTHVELTWERKHGPQTD
ncbi:hypothetical protein [Metapseudomonas otitidis]|uniref:hypothetical protein n=1 Tax=Metapseudomonas otitidis TaxID=319939 RepID=UPI0013F61CB3|nr:hypothetical protein [Pseudomonas otitidis]